MNNINTKLYDGNFHELNDTASSPRRAAEHTIWDDVVENIDDVFVDKFEKKNKPSVLFV